MKKTFSAIFLFLLIFPLFFSCRSDSSSPKSIAEKLKLGFVSKAHVSFRGIELDGVVTFASPETITLEIESPAFLKGFKISGSGGKMSLDYGGFPSFTFENADVFLNIGTLLAGPLGQIVSGENLTIKKGNDSLCISGKAGETHFELEADPETSGILSVSVNNKDLQVSFTDFVYNNGQ